MDFSLDIGKFLLLIIILSILGLNIFNYLSRATDITTEITKKGVSSGLGGVKKTAELSSKGVKSISDTIGDTIDTIDNDLDIKIIKPHNPNEPEPDYGKSGYCYIGKDIDQTRSCIYVGQGETCMSGDIFPRMDICINPSLRQ